MNYSQFRHFLDRGKKFTATCEPRLLPMGILAHSNLTMRRLHCRPFTRAAAHVTRRTYCSLRTLLSLSDQTVAVGREPERVLTTGLDLSIVEGERWIVLGANGCGKSTLATLLGERLEATRQHPRTSQRAADYISFETHQQLLQARTRSALQARYQ